MNFGRWLSSQKVRDDWIGELARAAAKDSRFPWAGEPIDMHDRIRAAMGGDADVLHAFQAALDEWNGGRYSLWEADKARRDAKREASIQATRAKFAEEDERRRRLDRRNELYRQRKEASGGGT